MVTINHKNKELESLITKGESQSYGRHAAKKSFLMALRSFYAILGVLDEITDLERYEYLQYKRSLEVSSVLISASRIQGKLLFKEFDSGSRIEIIDLIF